ncbi:DUF2892 domain-containing protein [Epibacterium sp. SM1969]|uniref:DUF2892 domain-containing protein n=1 Tax=Tritonibacter aquimaris TaxID=2663379 RepID=A0A844AKG5_9RHOB|nr:DUF2892 domain-containing protein [Tritonibacter aquimaris]MQY41609.1 DUF2892 domain-containing protein [Tritonibacter aquimaris]
MIKNLASWDRIARLIIGVALVAAYFAGIGGGLMVIGLIVGIVLAATSMMNHCPLYRIFGLATCPLEKH